MTNVARWLGTLRIKYKRKPTQKSTFLSDTYDYFNVPEGVYLELLESKSPMSFVGTEVKPKFAYKRFTKEDLEAENKIETPVSRPPPSPPSEDASFDVMLSQDEDTFASSEFTIKTAQALPVALTMRETLLRGQPFRFDGLTLVIREGQSGTGVPNIVAAIVRRIPGDEAAHSHNEKAYATAERAIRFMSEKLAGYIRINGLTPDANSMDQINEHGDIVKDGQQYFVQQVQMLDLGDKAWTIVRVPISDSGNRETNIPRQLANGVEERLKGVAFTDRAQADSYLVSSRIFEDFASPPWSVDPDEEAQAKAQLKERKNSIIEKSIADAFSQPAEFNISFLDDPDDIRF